MEYEAINALISFFMVVGCFLLTVAIVKLALWIFDVQDVEL